MPDLRQLRTFVAVAEQRSFTRAGELVHLKQQSVSKAVRELERELGVDLLERTTREVRLTAARRVLLEEGKHALEVTDAAFARTREVGTGLAGTIRIGYSPAIGPIDQTDVAHVLRAHGPDLSVELLEVRPAVLRPMLRAGELDLALTRIAGAVDPALHSANLRPTPLMLCVPQDPPARRSDVGRRDRARGGTAAHGEPARYALYGLEDVTPAWRRTQVGSSGTHTSSSRPAASSRASPRASMRSIFARAL